MKPFNLKLKLNIKLARREKVMILGGLSLLSALLLWELALSPLIADANKLEKQIVSEQQQLKELALLAKEYKSLKEVTGGFEATLKKRPQDFALFSMLETLAGAVKIKEHIKYMKPSKSKKTEKGGLISSSVEIRLEGITMEQLFDYMNRIEDPANVVWVKRLSIKRNQEEQGMIEATMQVSTLEIG